MCIHITGGQYRFIWFAVILVTGIIAFFGLYIPTYRRTLFAYLNVYIKADFLYSQGLCNEYDVYQPVVDEYSKKCIPLPGDLSPWICVHSADVDRFVSGYLLDGTLWEGETVILFEDLLAKDPEYGLIDLGANIGTHSFYNLSFFHSKHFFLVVKVLLLQRCYYCKVF
jgi:hypothetical protein